MPGLNILVMLIIIETDYIINDYTACFYGEIYCSEFKLYHKDTFTNQLTLC